MRLSVSLTVQQEALLKERAVAAGLSMAEWVRQAINSYCDADVNHHSAGSDSLYDAEIAALTSAQVTAITERDRAVAQVEILLERSRTLEGEVRAAELRAALTEKDLELAEGRRQSLKEVRSQLEERIVELKAMITHLQGEYARIATETNRALPEHTGTGQAGGTVQRWLQRLFG